MPPVVPFTTRELLPRSLRTLAPALDALSGLAALQRLYTHAKGADDFVAAALEILGIGIAVDDEGLQRIPATGPLLIAANHPHGAADGLAVATAVRRVRRDVKLLGNELLARIPDMRPHLITVDAFRPGHRRNTRALHEAVQWLRGGHALVVFPAGEVSYARASGGRVVDSAWRGGVARMAAGAEAPVLPMHISGGNSRLFLAAGRVHPVFRTALLARELLRLRGATISLRIGHAVSSRRLASLGETAAQAAYLRVRTYGLAPDTAPAGLLRKLRTPRAPAPLAPAVHVEHLAREIGNLPTSAKLLDNGPWTVFCVDSVEAPLTLLEIGRLRELTFRMAGEGTGRATDLDQYDRHYLHLFVWNAERRAIAGAYRVAHSDRIVERHGPGGLYTRSLFRYKRQLLSELGPSLELGRSFVAPDFQREFQPLLLLWRGIGRLIAREPRYRRLFGPVSISADYGAVTRQILARFLTANRYRSDLCRLVHPLRPLRQDAHDVPDALVKSTVASRLEDVDAIVRELEAGQRGIPVLLRQYLKLNARLLGFNVDPAFGHVLDGLVVVDLLDVDKTLLTRYLGKDGAAGFLAWHRGDPLAATAPVGARPAIV